MGNTKTLGNTGEALAAQVLQNKGLEVLCSNWHAPRQLGLGGEIDIIALDKANNVLIFAEVKTRRNQNFGSPAESVTPAKQAQLHALSEVYRQQHPQLATLDIRFDVIGILYNPATPNTPPLISHMENAL